MQWALTLRQIGFCHTLLPISAPRSDQDQDLLLILILILIRLAPLFSKGARAEGLIQILSLILILFLFLWPRPGGGLNQILILILFLWPDRERQVDRNMKS